MKFSKAVEWSHKMASEVISIGDTVIDGTSGNGHDTLFLLNQVGSEGKIYSFDIQDEAILSTREKLKRSSLDYSDVVLINANHAKMDDYIPDDCIGKVKVIMFNFGYLPGGDHSLTTSGDSSTKAVSLSLKYLELGGRLVLTFYTGHPGGKEEASQVTELLENLDPKKFVVLIYKFMNLPNTPPYVITVERVDR